jgi:hypothetical protein
MKNPSPPPFVPTPRPTPRPTPWPAPWGPLELREGEGRQLRIGPTDLWIERAVHEVRVASAPAPGGSNAPTESPPAGVSWARFALSSEDEGSGTVRVTLLPGLPSRTLIVEPEEAFTLRPRAEARVFVRIPLSIQVVLGDAEGSPVFEALTIQLSDTWWGTVMEGELASWLGTRARRAVDRSLLEPHLVICPLHLSNASNQDLRVERLAFRPELLSLFADAPGFWSDESRVRYQGDASGSDIEMTGRPPEEGAGGVLARAPRASGRGAGVRPLTRLIGLAGIGGVG